jgi:hypothetical protein
MFWQRSSEEERQRIQKMWTEIFRACVAECYTTGMLPHLVALREDLAKREPRIMATLTDLFGDMIAASSGTRLPPEAAAEAYEEWYADQRVREFAWKVLAEELDAVLRQ